MLVLFHFPFRWKVYSAFSARRSRGTLRPAHNFIQVRQEGRKTHSAARFPLNQEVMRNTCQPQQGSEGRAVVVVGCDRQLRHLASLPFPPVRLSSRRFTRQLTRCQLRFSQPVRSFFSPFCHFALRFSVSVSDVTVFFFYPRPFPVKNTRLPACPCSPVATTVPLTWQCFRYRC